MENQNKQVEQDPPNDNQPPVNDDFKVQAEPEKVEPEKQQLPVKVLNRNPKNGGGEKLEEKNKEDDKCCDCLNVIKEHPLYPAAVYLVNWRDPTRSGLVFFVS